MSSSTLKDGGIAVDRSGRLSPFHLSQSSPADLCLLGNSFRGQISLYPCMPDLFAHSFRNTQCLLWCRGDLFSIKLLPLLFIIIYDTKPHVNIYKNLFTENSMQKRSVNTAKAPYLVLYHHKHTIYRFFIAFYRHIMYTDSTRLLSRRWCNDR